MLTFIFFADYIVGPEKSTLLMWAEPSQHRVVAKKVDFNF